MDLEKRKAESHTFIRTQELINRKIPGAYSRQPYLSIQKGGKK